jgi:hypothetical protein
MRQFSHRIRHTLLWQAMHIQRQLDARGKDKDG